jgi:hypothetical protein
MLGHATQILHEKGFPFVRAFANGCENRVSSVIVGFQFRNLKRLFGASDWARVSDEFRERLSVVDTSMFNLASENPGIRFDRVGLRRVVSDNRLSILLIQRNA